MRFVSTLLYPNFTVVYLDVDECGSGNYFVKYYQVVGRKSIQLIS